MVVEVPPEPVLCLLFLLVLAESGTAVLSFRSQENVVPCPGPRAAALSSCQSPFVSPASAPRTWESGGQGRGGQHTWLQPGLCPRAVISCHSGAARHVSGFLYNPHTTPPRQQGHGGQDRQGVLKGDGGMSRGGPGLSSEQQAKPKPRNPGETPHTLAPVQKQCLLSGRKANQINSQ